MSTIIESIEQRQLRKVPRFEPGDRVRVHFQVIEGSRKRIQVFEGIVIARRGSGARETFTVRKQSFGVGVERTFPVHSPKVEQLEVVARGDVRRAKLYYLRGRVGKRARVAERRWGIEDDLVLQDAEEAVAVDSEGVAQEEAEPVPPEDGEEEQDAEQPQADAEQGAEAATEAEAEAEDTGDAEQATEPEATGDAEQATEPEAEDSDPEGDPEGGGSEAAEAEDAGSGEDRA